ncbi:MAG: hypothetical protein Q7K26_03925, partial [bacterium]|nr:hypothetical protein [bacterium]
EQHMKVKLTSELWHSRSVYRTGEVIDTETAGLDDVQLAALLAAGSALPWEPVAVVDEASDLAAAQAALAAAQAANEGHQRELSSLRAQVAELDRKGKPLADGTDRYRRKLVTDSNR